MKGEQGEMAKNRGAKQGKDNEKRTHKYLEEHGWLVHTVKAPPAVMRIVDGKTIWSATSAQDIFGLFDHVAVRRAGGYIECEPCGIPKGEFDKLIWDDTFGPDGMIKMNNMPSVVFIQTKSKKQYGKEMDIYANFPYKYKYIFVWTKNKSNRYELTIQKITKNS